ncbi:OsmC family protein [Arcticibacterium luteifluviistationis]|uniref:Osmotically inducible protein OsmC n=1 Tax=Arcticibacterium luteifluviistationis TaxID=1784714 RepID=A0A2Z4G6P0_9BACT|nr:OsmC family protein [Arcticibacterium luteifluviistationis]AWV96780.1 osmotically inducible protein OsmC [Arcticibacterium luteifluviistationis]
METHFYNVDIKWENSRKGIMCSPELNKKKGICIEVATPPEFPKGMEGIWSPEHLFVASVSGCLMTTFLAIAENSTLDFQSFFCHATGKLENVDGKLVMSEILLKPTVVIHNENYRNKAIRIVKKAEDACLISNSIKSKISMEITVLVENILIEST